MFSAVCPNADCVNADVSGGCEVRVCMCLCVMAELM